jgi:hypothetical protein
MANLETRATLGTRHDTETNEEAKKTQYRKCKRLETRTPQKNWEYHEVLAKGKKFQLLIKTPAVLLIINLIQVFSVIE